MPQDFVITDFKKFLSDPGYIGSYQGKGMYGYTLGYNSYNNNYFRIIKLPEVNQLNRTTVAHPTGQNAVIGMKFLSIGERTPPNHKYPYSCLLEYYLWGNTTYTYAPLAYNPQTNEKEIADDVITVGEYVVFATRDTRTGHAPVNLRISDTNCVLALASHINEQWQFLLPDYENVYGEIRLLPLGDIPFFIMAYTVFNSSNSQYYLCVHLIYLTGLLNGNNYIVSHEIELEKKCSDLVDLIYEPMVQAIVVLLNGEGVSALYHISPSSNATDMIVKLDYTDGNFYSIDTAGSDSYSNEVLYMAMGDNVIFLQNISNGINITQSCLEIKGILYTLREPPIINHIKAPLTFFSDDQVYDYIIDDAFDFYGTRICNEVQAK